MPVASSRLPPALLINQLQILGFYDTLLRFAILLEQLTELRKHLTYIYQFMTKGTGPE